MTHKEGDNPADIPTTHTVYDEFGRLSARYLPQADGESGWITESFGYDETHGLMTSHTTFGGAQITYAYDADDHGRMSSKTVPLSVDGSGNSRTTAYNYKDSGQLETVTVNGTETTQYFYDSRGRLEREVKPEGHELKYGYDAAGNRTRLDVIPHSDLNTDPWAYTYTYDGLNRLKAVTEIIDPGGANETSTLLATYFYDINSNRTWLVRGNGTATHWQYDQLNSLKVITHYRNFWASGDDLTAETNASMNNRIGSQGVEISKFEYALDPAGHRTGVTETLGEDGSTRRTREILYQYDSLYRLTQEFAEIKDENGIVIYKRTVDYTYDDRGNRRTMTEVTVDTAGTQTTTKTFYEYNARDELLSESVNPPEVAAFWPADGDTSRFARSMFQNRPPPKYSPHGVAAYFAVMLLTMMSAFFVAWGPKRRGRAKRILHTSLCLFFVPLFILDPSNLFELNQWAMTRTAMAQAAPDATVTRYEYDGNRNFSRKYVDANNNGSFDISELVKSINTYDAENRLLSHFDQPEPSDVTVTSYAYDHTGARITKDQSVPDTEPIRFLVDTSGGLSHVLAEIEGTGTERKLVKRYALDHDLLTQTDITYSGDPEQATATRHYFHTDGQLSTRQLTDDAGASSVETTRYGYDAFGADLDELPGGTSGVGDDALTPNVNEALSVTSYRYTGEQFDGESGLYHLRARQYDPIVGRFNEQDPVMAATAWPCTLNRYKYACNSPLLYHDPLGLFTQQIGYDAEDAISDIYAQDHPEDVVFYGRWSRAGPKWLRAFSLKPDIVNHTRETWLEIKPLSASGLAAGAAQFATYLAEFAIVGYGPEYNWDPSTNYTFAGSLPIFFFNIGGIVFYTDTLDAAEDLVGIAAFGKLAEYLKSQQGLRIAQSVVAIGTRIAQLVSQRIAIGMARLRGIVVQVALVRF